MLNLVLGVGVFSLLPNRIAHAEVWGTLETHMTISLEGGVLY